jgi:phosphoribosyl-ATP pyrophosphohydrolase/phosphoribosyl-AMP cyclohydrolase
MLIPSIDLMKRKAVQLVQGREKVIERDDPEALAAEFGRFGRIAVIDLDAAFGEGDNEALIRRLCVIAECTVGGGIRTVEKARKMFSYGAAQVILGSRLFEGGKVDIEFAQSVAAVVGRERVIAAIDALDPYVGGYLFTAVEKEGMLQGPAFDRIEAVRALTKRPITAAGGVSTVAEVARLDRMEVDAQVGMALYTGKMTPAECFLETLDWEKLPLIPAITQDEAGQVLMLAYMNKEALEKTLATGKVTYWSRSRKELWTKGDTSGHYQTLRAIRRDCDGDALLLTVAQEGPACHTDRYSCFGDRRFSLAELYDVLMARIASGDAKSYTAKLSPKELRQKLLEEAAEVALADDRDNKVWEAADLLYFLTVLLAKEQIGLDEVMNELQRRRRK